MDFTKFNLTPSAKSAIEESRKIADELGHLKVVDLHLVYILLLKDNANIGFSLQSVDINQAAMVDTFYQILEAYKEPKRKKKIYAPEIFEILELSAKIAKKKGHDYIGVDHIFLSCLQSRDEITEFLNSLEIDVEKLHTNLSECISKGFESITPQGNQAAAGSAQTKNSNPTENCCENLNQKIAKRGTFEIFGRDKEIERAFEILLRKNKSNIIFVGEAGVGKTALVEGMAEKIVQRECPDLLLHKEILTLDITSVISGTIFRGQMEEKMKNILEFVSQNPQYILFIDEIHTIIGSGGSEGSLDLANILKPALSRGEISCI
jgi:ATP-dependent Clp protease ATP-binding subunit ClpC